MKEKRFKGLWALIVVLVIFGGVAIGLQIMLNIVTQPSYIADRGGAYPESFGSNTALRVEAIDDIGPMEGSDTSRMYLVAVGDKIVAVVGHKDDPSIKAALEASDLDTNPVWINGTVSKTSTDRSNLNTIKEGLTAEAKPLLETGFVVDADKNFSDNRMLQYAVYGSAAIAILFTGFYAYLFVKRKKGYDEIYAQFPELEGNLDLLVTQGQYADEYRGLFVYKDMIICLGQRNHMVPAHDLLYVVAVKHTVNQGLASNVSYTIETYNKAFKKQVLAPNLGKKKELDDDINQFCFFLDATYPEMLVGADHAPEYQALKNAAR